MYTIKKVWSHDITELIDKHANLDREEVNRHEDIVYKVSEKLLENLRSSSSNYNQLAARWPGRSVYLLVFCSGAFSVFLVNKDRLEPVKDSDNLIKRIRNYDLEQILLKNEKFCSIKAPRGGHFITPSGRHAKIFIRVADAISSYNAMDRISYWVQERIDETVSGIIIDTPALLSVVSHASSLRGTSIPFTCLDESAVASASGSRVDSIIRKFSNRIPKDGKILVLISMSVSGEAERSIIRRIESAGIKNQVESWSVFSANGSDCLSKCRLSFDLKWYKSKDDCELCKSPVDQKTYEIDARTFFPKLSKKGEAKLRAAHVNNVFSDNGIRDFYRKYGKQRGVFRFHYSDPNDGYNSRHHAFYVHVLSLLENEDFKEEFLIRLDSMISDRGKIDLIIHPPHPAARKIVDIAKSRHRFLCIESSSLSSESPGICHAVKSAKHILIIDDVLVTGRRQIGYLGAIRDICTGANHSLRHLSFFPLVSRPHSQEVVRDFKVSLQRHPWETHFDTLYGFLLPSWSENSCPWCQERKILSDCVSDPMGEDEWFQERIEYLDDHGHHGLIDNPLLSFSSSDESVMSAGSPIVDEGHGQSVVLFVLASALQVLRHDEKSPLGNNILFENLFSSNTLSQYSDPLVQACLIKATSPDEWTDELYEIIFSEGVDHAFGRHSPALLAEVLMRAIQASRERKFTNAFIAAYQAYLDRSSVRQIIDRYRYDAVQD